MWLNQLSLHFKKLGLEQTLIKKIKCTISQTCLRSSYVIYLSRKNIVWRPWEDKKQTNIKHVTSSLGPAYDFVGFTKQEIFRAKLINERKTSSLVRRGHINDEEENNFIGFSELEIKNTKIINSKRKDILQKLQDIGKLNTLPMNKTCPQMVLVKGTTDTKHEKSLRSKCKMVIGIKNLGNTCYMNSVMQCLNSLTPLVSYFEGNTYLGDIHSESKYNGTVANEVSNAFKAMNGRTGPISLVGLKNLIGNLYSPFKGFRQEDAHEFLIKLMELMMEDLGNGKTAPHYSPEAIPSNQNLNIFGILHGVHRITITCKSCKYTSFSLEPFNVLSLSLPPNKKSNVEELLKCFYGDMQIGYTCPRCGRQNSCIQKYEIESLPHILILHLKRFDVSTKGIVKNKKYIEFPLKNLKMGNRELVCNLKSITNHYGTLNTGHYVSFCKSRYKGDWFKCDDTKITKMNESIKTPDAYLLYYEIDNTHNSF